VLRAQAASGSSNLKFIGPLVIVVLAVLVYLVRSSL
jgi:hypothetical protein